jgi:UDPglucose--hexose-1-phosphate uridylyltransferase
LSSLLHQRPSACIFIRGGTWRFGDINADEIADLVQVLRTVLDRLYVGLQDPDFNYTIRTAPAEYAGVKYFH